MGLHTILHVLVCYHLLFHYRVQCNWNLSREENFDIDRQLKLMNRPSLKTIENKYGDIYDCVDFYKQIAKDHPLFKNQTFYFQENSFSQYNKTRELDYSEVEVCPVGSVPIRRITKYDLVKERQAYGDRLMDTTNRPGTYLAIMRTKGAQDRYTGVVGDISIHNPKAFGRQFSTSRIKLRSGHNSIEAGWRVDPTLYGDSKTRLFVRTDVGTSHCFNTRCPGFVHTSRELPIDFAFSPISVPGGKSYYMPFRIIQDKRNGKWNLVIGTHNKYLGFWPSNIFNGLPNYIEWGAAAYSPPGSPLPQMGSGNFPKGDIGYDAYISNLKIVNENGKAIDANYIEAYADDSTLYSAMDFGWLSGHWGHVMLYGGSGKRKN